MSGSACPTAWGLQASACRSWLRCLRSCWRPIGLEVRPLLQNWTGLAAQPCTLPEERCWALERCQQWTGAPSSAFWWHSYCVVSQPGQHMPRCGCHAWLWLGLGRRLRSSLIGAYVAGHGWSRHHLSAIISPCCTPRAECAFCDVAPAPCRGSSGLLYAAMELHCPTRRTAQVQFLHLELEALKGEFNAQFTRMQERKLRLTADLQAKLDRVRELEELLGLPKSEVDSSLLVRVGCSFHVPAPETRALC